MRRWFPSHSPALLAAVLIVAAAAAASGIDSFAPEREAPSPLVTNGFDLAVDVPDPYVLPDVFDAVSVARAVTPVNVAGAVTSVRAVGGNVAVDDNVEAALRELAPVVGRTSHPNALRDAFRAYFNYRRANPRAVKKPYYYFVDFGLSNSTPRGWVFDMDRLELVEGPFTVAHGRGSSRVRNEVPKSFSNRPGSKTTSLGLYLAQETYRFSGSASGGRYSSIGLRMKGESGDFNNAARRRGVVAHGAPYVTKSGAGRSEGCPAMEMSRARRLLPLLANGGVVFIYSPNDSRWLGREPWLQA